MAAQLTPRISKAEFIALIAALFAINALAIDIMLPTLGVIANDLGVAAGNERQYIISTYLLGFGAAQFLFGPLTDRYGRRIPLIIGLVVYFGAAMVAAFSNNFETLLALRLLQGMGAAVTRVAGQAAIRDRYESREMAEVMSLVFMVFLTVPVIAPAIGQTILIFLEWHAIFIGMGIGALLVTVWSVFRFDETLRPENMRLLTSESIFGGFMIVISNRMALFYALASTFIVSALLGFINSAQQIYVEIYDLGDWFPLAFAAVSLLMAVSSFLNSRAVRRFGQRRLSHGSVILFTLISAVWLAISYIGNPPFWLFLSLFAAIMFTFGWCSSNLNALSLEPLGSVAGTASSVYGSIQTVLSALLGMLVGQMFDGTQLPLAAGFTGFGLLALVSILIAEQGKLFGVGEKYAKQ